MEISQEVFAQLTNRAILKAKNHPGSDEGVILEHLIEECEQV